MATGSRQFSIRVVGVTHTNPDGISRQAVIRRCRPGQPVALVHDSDNPHDPNAVAVGIKRWFRWRQAGFVPADVAGRMVEEAGRGWKFDATVERVTGGTGDKPNYGLTIRITKYKAE